MPCQEIQSWTFNGLVGAFLDVSIAFLLLCASALAYIASKFLGLFGLSLPCPCNGLFGDPNSNICWQKVLVDGPSKKISSIQFSVNSRFPFDSILDRNLNSRLMKLVNERNPENGCVGFEGEESCSLLPEKRSGKGIGSRRICMTGKKENQNGILRRKVRCNIRRRRKCDADGGKFSSTLSFDLLQSDARALPLSPPAGMNKMVDERNEGSIVLVSSGGDALPYGGQALADIALPGKISHGLESNALANQNEAAEKDTPHDDNFECNSQLELFVDGNINKTIRILEQALQREHAARAALYLELEKERSSAATAADEAMAMILRLQVEKASIEMEARQYQRMIEEKSAYDFEEMSILKEILLRREREKHFLEKEVEVYRQMIFESDKLDSDAQDMEATHGQRVFSLLHSFEDLALTLQRTSESTSKVEVVENANKILHDEIRYVGSQNCTVAFEKELPIPELDEPESLNQGYVHIPQSIDKLNQQLSSGNEGTTEEFQEKEVVSLDSNALVQERTTQKLELKSKSSLSTTWECNFPGSTVVPVEEVLQQSDSNSASRELITESTENCDKNKFSFSYSCDNSEDYKRDTCNSSFDVCPYVYDVHNIDDKLTVCGKVSENGRGSLPVNATLDIARTCHSPTMDLLGSENITRSYSGTSSGLPPVGYSQSKAKLSELRRNSMSAVDFERFKIDNEVGWLRERLRIVQEGREKLSTSMGSREKEKVQLPLFENVVSELQEIRQVTESGRAVQQTSMPLASCKEMLKKGRWRSFSLGVHRSR